MSLDLEGECYACGHSRDDHRKTRHECLSDGCDCIQYEPPEVSEPDAAQSDEEP